MAPELESRLDEPPLLDSAMLLEQLALEPLPTPSSVGAVVTTVIHVIEAAPAEEPERSSNPIAETMVAETTVAETTVAEPMVAEPMVAATTDAEPMVAEPMVAETTDAETTGAEPSLSWPSVPPEHDDDVEIPGLGSRRRRPRRTAYVMGALAIGIAGTCAFLLHSGRAVPWFEKTIAPLSETRASVPQPPAPIAVPLPTAAAAPLPTAASAADESAAAPVAEPGTPATEPPASDTGLLTTGDAPPGRRIFVDQRVVGQTPDPISVKCGQHVVRVGSTGKPLTVDVPCGGEVTVGQR